MKRRSFFGALAGLSLLPGAASAQRPEKPLKVRNELTSYTCWKYQDIIEIWLPSGVDLCIGAVEAARDRFRRTHQIFPDVLCIAKDGPYTRAAEIRKTFLDDFDIKFTLAEDAALGNNRAWYVARQSQLYTLTPVGSGGLGYVGRLLGR